MRERAEMALEALTALKEGREVKNEQKLMVELIERDSVKRIK